MQIKTEIDTDDLAVVIATSPYAATHYGKVQLPVLSPEQAKAIANQLLMAASLHVRLVSQLTPAASPAAAEVAQ